MPIYKKKQKTINIPADLHRSIKKDADKDDMRMRTLVIELLETGRAVRKIR